jgi:hypothetical protein
LVSDFGGVGLNLTPPSDYPESWAWGATAAGGGERERTKGENKEFRERVLPREPKRLCFRAGPSNPTPATKESLGITSTKALFLRFRCWSIADLYPLIPFYLGGSVSAWRLDGHDWFREIIEPLLIF